MKSLIAIFAFLCGCFFNLNAQNEIIDKSTGETFPRAISFESEGKEYQLEATGVATRKRLIVKVYSIVHYLQKGVEVDLQEIMSDVNAKQFTIKWVHEVGVDKIKSSFQDALHNVFTPEKYDALKNEINRFLGFFNQNVNKNDVHNLRWTPGGHIEVIINGKSKGSIASEEFAVGLWSIWLGQKSVVDRNDLISH